MTWFSEFLVGYLTVSLLIGVIATFAVTYPATGAPALRSLIITILANRITEINGGQSISALQSAKAAGVDIVKSMFRPGWSRTHTREDDIVWARSLQKTAKDATAAQDFEISYRTLDAMLDDINPARSRQGPKISESIAVELAPIQRDFTQRASNASSFADVRRLEKAFTTQRLRLIWAAIRSRDYRLSVLPLARTLLDNVGRGTAGGLLFAACIELSATSVPVWIDDTAIYPVVGGAVGSVTFSVILFREFARSVPIDDTKWNRLLLGHPVVVSSLFPAFTSALFIIPQLLAVLVGGAGSA